MDRKTFDQDRRTARALREVAEDYEFTRHNPGEWICESPAGNAYLVSEESCTCGDWMHRASQCGGRCKHQVALGHKLIAAGASWVAQGMRLQKDPEPESPADFAAISARLTAQLGRPVQWTQADEAAFARIFG
jgi:hypothetical protein